MKFEFSYLEFIKNLITVGVNVFPFDFMLRIDIRVSVARFGRFLLTEWVLALSNLSFNSKFLLDIRIASIGYQTFRIRKISLFGYRLLVA